MSGVLQPVATTTAATALDETAGVSQPPAVAILTLRKPRVQKKVEWTNDTVDNENMNKKKSKCCCIFKKKREFGESDSEDDADECDNCSGHVERKMKFSKMPEGSGEGKSSE